MRLVTYDAGRGPRAGLLQDQAIADVWDALGDAADASVDALLEGNLLPQVAALEIETTTRLADARLRPPVTRPGKIVCVGLNYRSHAEEAGLEPPETPTFFAKFTNALAGDGDEVPLPAYSSKVDYEAEVAFVIGRRCRDVAEPDALDAIAGYTLLNDLSARDFQFKTMQWMPGKVFDRSAPIGPALVTPDEAGPHDAIGIGLELNGETMQSSTTADLIHSVPALVAYLSMLMTLESGDVVSTGTPAGVGSVREPRVWLGAGDEVAVVSPTLGRLANRMIAG